MNLTTSFFMNLRKYDSSTITTKSEKIPDFGNITKVAGFIEDCFDNITMEICQSLDLDRDNMIDQMGKLIMEFVKVLKERKQN